MYFRELVFRKPRLSNDFANLSSPSPLEMERNQRKTSDLASDMFQGSKVPRLLVERVTGNDVAA